MSTYKGIPFNGGMDSPTGTGAQHIVETCQAICDWLVDGSIPATLTDLSALPAANWSSRYLFDDTGSVVVDWNNKQLGDTAGNTSIDWGNHSLKDTAGNTVLDWENCLLIPPGQSANLDWANFALSQSNGSQVMSWLNGIGFFGVGSTVQQTGGAAVAGAVYTATEQGMINRMYNALRAYGLLT